MNPDACRSGFVHLCANFHLSMAPTVSLQICGAQDMDLFDWLALPTLSNDENGGGTWQLWRQEWACHPESRKVTPPRTMEI